MSEEKRTTVKMEKMLGRIPSSTPQVSWFEFLLDKSGTLLKKHVDSGNLGLFLKK